MFENTQRTPLAVLAYAHTGKEYPIQVLRACAGHFLGTADENEGLMTRESLEYFPSHEAAERALHSGQWTQRYID